MHADFNPAESVPVADAARQLRMSRERAIRLIQSGELAGGLAFGRWYVDRNSLTAREARQRDPLAEAADRVRRARTGVRYVQPIGDRQAGR